MQMKRWAVAVIGCVLVAGSVPAVPPPGGAPAAAPAAGQPRMGMVYIVGGAFEGEIDEVSVPNKVVITTRDKTKTTIDRRAIDKIVYYDTPKNEFDAKMSQLKPNDATGRIALARWAISVKQPGLAREALVAAARINPNLPDLRVLNDEVAKMTAPAPAATQAVAAATKPAANDPAPAVAAASLPVRLVSPAEINLIRQLEWQARDKNVKAQVPADVRKRFIDSGVMPPAEAAALPPQQLAWEILQHGQPAMKEAVKIVNDPQQLMEFNTKINRIIQTGCIQCHANGKLVGKNNKLALFQGENLETSYSNYLLLNQFSTTVNGVRYEMIDRTRPDGSLLLQFSLPPNIAEIPHPPVPPVPSPQYAGAVKTRAEPKFRDLSAWVRSLAPIPPTFDINLSVPLAKPEKGPARP